MSGLGKTTVSGGVAAQAAIGALAGSVTITATATSLNSDATTFTGNTTGFNLATARVPAFRPISSALSMSAR